MRRLIPLALLLALPAGCRSLAAYATANPQGDGPRDIASVPDGDRADTIAPPPDSTPLDVPFPDTSVSDGGPHPPDLMLADFVPPTDTLFHSEAGSCYENEQVVEATPCYLQRQGCSTALPLDADCDGLPDQLDPDASCNKLVVNEPFSSGIVGWMGASGPYLGCGVELSGGAFWSTGKYPTGNNVWVLGLRHLSDPYTVGAKITLSKQVAANKHYAACVLRAVATGLDLKTEVWTPTKAGPAGTLSPNQTTALVQGAYFTLAAWAEGTRFVCAVHDEAGGELLRATYDHDTAITGTAEARISTANVSAWLDHLRIFERP